MDRAAQVNLIGDERPFGEIFGMEAALFDHLDVSTLPLPVRAIHRLPAKNINTIGDLLRYSPSTIMKIKGLGSTTVLAILDYISSLNSDLGGSNDQRSEESENIEKESVSGPSSDVRAIAKEYSYKIACGDFSCFDMINLSENDEKYVSTLKCAYDDLGDEFALQAVVAPEMFEPIRSALLSFIYENKIIRKKSDELNEKYFLVPLNRRSQPAIHYISAFSRDENKRKELMRIYHEGDTLDDYCQRMIHEHTMGISTFPRFLSWLSFDVEVDLSTIIAQIFNKPTDVEVIRLRGSRKTLQEVGQVIGVTRERVRQIESRVLRKFVYQYNRVRLLSKICAIRGGDTVLTPIELEQYFGDHAVELIYLLSKVEKPTDYIYEKQTNSFIVGSLTQAECLGEALDSLPEVFHDEEADKVISSV